MRWLLLALLLCVPLQAQPPLTDVAGSYQGYPLGLYPGGNEPPADHAALLSCAASQVTAGGVYLSVGHSICRQLFCCQGVGCTGCTPESLEHQYDGRLTLINGAWPAQFASLWTDPQSPNYDRIQTSLLSPLGLSESDVQVVYLRTFDPPVTHSLADAVALVDTLSEVCLSLAVRYPNLRLILLSSRVYGGYANPAGPGVEPHAYETGLSIKWTIQAQLDGDPLLSLVPPLAWAEYAWAPWPSSHFSDGLHLSADGVQALASAHMQFLRSSAFTDWAWRAGDCDRNASVNTADAFAVLNALFSGGTLYESCDANQDGQVDIADAVTLLK